MSSRQPTPEGATMVAVRMAEVDTIAPPLPEQSEAVASKERLISEDFDARMEDILFEKRKHANRGDAHAGHESAANEYIRLEENPDLQKFGKLMLLAPWAYDEDRKLVELKQIARHTRSEAEEFSKAKRIVCSYNQLVVGLAADNEAAMPPRKLEHWLTKASGGRHSWATRMMSGVHADLGARDLIMDVPGIRGVMHGDLDQDLLGMDYVFEPTPSGDDSLDVKSRRLIDGKRPVERDKTGRLILNIDPQMLEPDSYRVKSRWRSGYVDELTMKLMK